MKPIAPLALSLALALPAASTHAATDSAAAQLYQNNCAVCHGANMEGAVGPTLLQHKWLHGEPTKANLQKVIGNGVPDKGMPAWSAILKPADIEALAGYVAEYANVIPAARNGVSQVTPVPDIAGFKLPKGFRIAVYADGVPAARALAVSSSGIVYVGSRAAGKVYALVPGSDRTTANVVVIAEKLEAPIGLTLVNGSLYVAEISRVIRFDDIDKRYANKPAYTVVTTALPHDKAHGEKVIKLGPDGKLYIPVGAPCNTCDKEDAPHSKIWRMDPDGSHLEEYARGVRNVVGFAFHPETKALWFTDNGPDNLGDNGPSCELNLAPKPGLHFGFPYCHGGAVLDPKLANGRTCDEFVAPVAKLGPHVAPLGLAFYTGTQFPAATYRNNVFVTEHGSWNRPNRIGYRVSLITLAGDKVVSDTPFLEGFLRGEAVVGRPADVAVLADGSMLVSDDYGGRVWRITYDGK